MVLFKMFFFHDKRNDCWSANRHSDGRSTALRPTSCATIWLANIIFSMYFYRESPLIVIFQCLLSRRRTIVGFKNEKNSQTFGQCNDTNARDIFQFNRCVVAVTIIQCLLKTFEKFPLHVFKHAKYSMYVSDDCIEINLTGDNIYAAVGVLRIGSR